MDTPAVVMDVGTGYTKLGYAGNTSPQAIIPTAIGIRNRSFGETLAGDFDFVIGNDCYNYASTHNTLYPIKHGMVYNWNAMEKFWKKCIFDELRCNPTEHYFLMTEPPLNPPEHREQLAEIMFETFNIPGLYISVQAVLAIAASWTSKICTHRDLTGLVIDSGDGLTHIIPVADGHVIGSGIQQFPYAGREVTNFILNQMRHRKELVPSEQSLETAKIVKETLAYVCPDVSKENEKYESFGEKYIKRYEGIQKSTGQKWHCNVSKERYLAPETMFQPQLLDVSAKHLSLPQLVDIAIQECPLDVRKKLYGNIVLSGGNTMFKDFGRRLQRDVNQIIKRRHDKNFESLASHLRSTPHPSFSASVLGHTFQDYAVWFGGSMLATTSQFKNISITKRQYEEEGPRIARQNVAFNAQF